MKYLLLILLYIVCTTELVQACDTTRLWVEYARTPNSEFNCMMKVYKQGSELVHHNYNGYKLYIPIEQEDSITYEKDAQTWFIYEKIYRNNRLLYRIRLRWESSQFYIERFRDNGELQQIRNIVFGVEEWLSNIYKDSIVHIRWNPACRPDNSTDSNDILDIGINSLSLNREKQVSIDGQAYIITEKFTLMKDSLFILYYDCPDRVSKEVNYNLKLRRIAYRLWKPEKRGRYPEWSSAYEEFGVAGDSNRTKEYHGGGRSFKDILEEMRISDPRVNMDFLEERILKFSIKYRAQFEPNEFGDGEPFNPSCE